MDTHLQGIHVVLIPRVKRLNNQYINHKKSRGKECIHVTIFNNNLALVKNKTNMADLTTLKWAHCNSNVIINLKISIGWFHYVWWQNEQQHTYKSFCFIKGLAKYVQWLKYYCHKSIFFVIYYVGRYLTLYVVSSGIRTHNVSGDRHWLHSYKYNYRTITTATAPRNKYITGILLKVC